MATPNSVKNKIQGLIDAANATTAKNDDNLTDSVNSLIAGFGQGGECSGDHVIPVTELPTENIDEGALYECKGSYFQYGGKALKDIIVRENGVAESLVDMYTQQVTFELYYADNVEDIPVGDRKPPNESTFIFPLYYDGYTDDVVIWAEEWLSLSEAFLEGLTSGGAITNPDTEATTDLYYYALIGDDWKEYVLSEGQRVIEVDELPTENIDESAVYTIKSKGACYADLGLPPLPIVDGYKYYFVGVNPSDSTGETSAAYLFDLPYSYENKGTTIHGKVYIGHPSYESWLMSRKSWTTSPTDVELRMFYSAAKFANYNLVSDWGTFIGGSFAPSYFTYKDGAWKEHTITWGVREITEAGKYDVTECAEVIVDVPTPPTICVVRSASELPSDVAAYSLGFVLGGE